LAQDATFKKAYVEKSLSKFKIDELSQYLDFQGVVYPLSSNRSELIKLVQGRLNEHIQSEMVKVNQEVKLMRSEIIKRKNQGEITDLQMKKQLVELQKFKDIKEYEFNHKLLEEANQLLVYSEYPLFFKNPDGRSAIDTALDLNQVQSVEIMINYMIKHQNHYIWHHLFKFNMIKLIHKKVKCFDLFQSEVLVQDVNYVEWPGANRNL